MIKTD